MQWHRVGSKVQCSRRWRCHHGWPARRCRLFAHLAGLFVADGGARTLRVAAADAAGNAEGSAWACCSTRAKRGLMLLTVESPVTVVQLRLRVGPAKREDKKMVCQRSSARCL
jgi:hypothetical protein